MHCYELELMRGILRGHVARAAPGTRVDELALVDALTERGVESLVELRTLDPAALSEIVLALADDVRLAA